LTNVPVNELVLGFGFVVKGVAATACRLTSDASNTVQAIVRRKGPIISAYEYLAYLYRKAT
jgi:hypothetical protein